MSTREMIAYGLIVAIIAVIIPTTIALTLKRRREKRRRRGIKNYNRIAPSQGTPSRG